MSVIPFGQSYFRIEANMRRDVTNALQLLVEYQKPDTTEGSWEATGITDASSGEFYYEGKDGDLDVMGVWRVWGAVQFSDGRWGYGKMKEFKVVEKVKNK